MQIDPKLKSKIIEAVPGIMELDWGCKVEFTDRGMWMQKASTYMYIFTGVKAREDIGLFYKDTEFTQIGVGSVSKEFNKIVLTAQEILKITKDKELICIDKELLKKGFNFETFNGWFKIIGRTITLHDIRQTLLNAKFTPRDYFSEIADMWNDKDDLSKQSEQLIKLLEKILL